MTIEQWVYKLHFEVQLSSKTVCQHVDKLDLIFFFD